MSMGLQKAYRLYSWQSPPAFFLFSSLMEVPSSVTPIFLLHYWFLGFYNFFFLTHRRENFNKNKPALSEQ
jgi:hypothetical protein